MKISLFCFCDEIRGYSDRLDLIGVRDRLIVENGFAPREIQVVIKIQSESELDASIKIILDLRDPDYRVLNTLEIPVDIQIVGQYCVIPASLTVSRLGQYYATISASKEDGGKILAEAQIDVGILSK